MIEDKPHTSLPLYLQEIKAYLTNIMENPIAPILFNVNSIKRRKRRYRHKGA